MDGLSGISLLTCVNGQFSLMANLRASWALAASASQKADLDQIVIELLEHELP